MAELNAEWGRSRWLWNQAVTMQRRGERPTFKYLSAELTKVRARQPWMAAGSAVVQQQTLRTFDRALRESFKVKGRGRPKHKKRKASRPSLQYVGDGVRIKDGALKLPHGVSIPVVWSRELPSKPTSVRVFQDSLEHWYASFVVRREPTLAPSTEAAIGIDWGIKTTATTTDPAYDLPYQGHRKRCAAELAKAQRKMSRRSRLKRQRQSNGYKQARREAAKVHKRASRQAQHSGRVWARSVVDNHGFIAVEDFKPTFLATSRMARKAADASIGIVKRTLIEMAARGGRTVVIVPTAYTTMTCSSCFARAKQRLELSERTFHCKFCDYKQDRDRNAAQNILQAGFNLASADGIRQWQLARAQHCNLS